MYKYITTQPLLSPFMVTTFLYHAPLHIRGSLIWSPVAETWFTSIDIEILRGVAHVETDGRDMGRRGEMR
jgi:hypothetical protein